MGAFDDVKNSSCYLDDLSGKYLMESRSFCGAFKALNRITTVVLGPSDSYTESV